MKTYSSLPDFEQGELPLRGELSFSFDLTRAYAYVAMAQMQSDDGQYTRAIELCEHAIEIFQQFDREGIAAIHAHAYSIIAESYVGNNLGQFRQAATAAASAVELFRQIDSPRLEEMLRLEGNYWFDAGEFERALACRQELITNEEEGEDEPGAAGDLFDVGKTLIKLERWQDARSKFLQAREEFEFIPGSTGVQDCDRELEWLEHIELLQKKELALVAYAIRRFDPNTPGYSRWMISRRMQELRRMTVNEFRDQHGA